MDTAQGDASRPVLSHRQPRVLRLSGTDRGPRESAKGGGAVKHSTPTAPLPRWADVDCPNGDTFRVRIDGYGTGWQIWDNGEWWDTPLREAFERHLGRCEWLTVDVEAASMYEL